MLDVYETAFLCGGGERVALVALVRLAEDGRIKIASARHRVTAVRPDPGSPGSADDPVAAAALASLPSTGATLGRFSHELAVSDAVSDVRKSLVEQGLWRGRTHDRRGRTRIRRGGALTRRGRAVRAELDPGTPLDRIAVLGVAGIPDARLRKIFATPDPDLSGARWFRRHPLVRGRVDYDGPSGTRFGPGFESESQPGSWGGDGGSGSW